MKHPRHIQVFSYDIEVTTPDGIEMDHNEVEGRFLQSAERIEIRGDRPVAMTRDTLLHEVLHAVLAISGTRAMVDLEREDEEKIVSGLAPALLHVLRDNPKLAAFLLG